MKKTLVVFGIATALVAVILFLQQKNPSDISSAQSAASFVKGAAISAENSQSAAHMVAHAEELSRTDLSSIRDEEIIHPPEDLSDSAPKPSDIRLWQLPQSVTELVIDGVRAAQLSVDLRQLASLHVGQMVRFELPHNRGEVEAKITDTYNDPGAQVWKGSIAGDTQHAVVIISRGAVETHVIIASTQGNFSAVIDNHSGLTTLIDEGAIRERQLPFDDGVVFKPDSSESIHP